MTTCVCCFASLRFRIPDLHTLPLHSDRPTHFPFPFDSIAPLDPVSQCRCSSAAAVRGDTEASYKKVAYQATGAEARPSYRRRTNSRDTHVNSPKPLQHASPVLGSTPFDEEDEYRDGHMSLDRPPSPAPGGGWASPGLAPNSNDAITERRASRSPAKRNYGDLASAPVTWETAKASSARVNGYTSNYNGQNQGFFAQHIRRFSSGLPHFRRGVQDDRYAEKEKLGRGRIRGRMPFRGWTLQDWRDVPRHIGMLISRRRKYVAVLLMFILGLVLFNNPCECRQCSRACRRCRRQH